MRSARFKVAPELLSELLHMPADVTFVAASVDTSGAVVFVVNHPDLPEADEPHDCDPTVTLHPEKFSWDWGVA